MTLRLLVGAACNTVMVNENLGKLVEITRQIIRRKATRRENLTAEIVVESYYKYQLNVVLVCECTIL